MTKAELTNAIANETGISADTVMAVIEDFMKITKNSLANGESIFLRGFGTFATKERAAKTARNIGKGTTIEVPAHNVPTFKPCNEFKEQVRMK